jgi:hypothetical protein
MNRRTTFVMILVVLAGFGIILFINMSSMLGIHSFKYISPNWVRGSAVVHAQLPYTLNFEQQNRLIDILNRAISISETMTEKRKAEAAQPLDISKVIIYRFNEADIEIHPAGYVKKLNSASSTEENAPLAMVLNAPGLDPKGLLEETTPGELQQLLSQTFDR